MQTNIEKEAYKRGRQEAWAKIAMLMERWSYDSPNHSEVQFG